MAVRFKIIGINVPSNHPGLLLRTLNGKHSLKKSMNVKVCGNLKSVNGKVCGSGNIKIREREGQWGSIQ